MAESAKVIEIDPNGDTLIILKDPNTALLEWKTREETSKDTERQEAREQDEGRAEDAESREDVSLEVWFLVSSRQLRIVSPYF
jgi:hypothetical protein